MKKDQKIARNIAQTVIQVLEKRKYEGALVFVIEELQRHLRVSNASIYSPRDLKKKEKEKIKMFIEKLTSIRVSDYFFERDEKLIDGIKIVIGDKVWDFSLSRQLKELKS